MAKFELRKSPVDGKVRRWERRRASSVTDISACAPLVDPEAASAGAAYDYFLWVCTGVFDHRRDVFRQPTGGT